MNGHAAMAGLTETTYIDRKAALTMFDELARQPESGRLLEVGTGFGHSTLFFARARPKWTIYTVDSFGLFGDGRIYRRLEHDAVAGVFCQLREAHNVIQVLGDSSAVPWELPINALFIDGGHAYEACKADWERYAPFLTTGGVAFLHDYHRADFGVRRVVEEACGNGWALSRRPEKLAVLVRAEGGV